MNKPVSEVKVASDFATLCRQPFVSDLVSMQIFWARLLCPFCAHLSYLP